MRCFKLIFVTLGTQDKQFTRLLDAVEKLNTDEEIIVQAGSTSYNSKKMKIYQYLSKDVMNDYMKKARVVISHAGVGTIINGLKLHKKMIVAARLKKYNEHVNDHQLQILNTFAKEEYIIPLNNYEELENLLMKDFKPKEFLSNKENFNKCLEEKINNL